jgi:hypothetical protein
MFTTTSMTFSLSHIDASLSNVYSENEVVTLTAAELIAPGPFPPWDSERARIAAYKSAEVRKAKAAEKASLTGQKCHITQTDLAEAHSRASQLRRVQRRVWNLIISSPVDNMLVLLETVREAFEQEQHILGRPVNGSKSKSRSSKSKPIAPLSPIPSPSRNHDSASTTAHPAAVQAASPPSESPQEDDTPF